MAGVKLYEGLIKATEQIVAKFGNDVLREDRFVNILQDMYPDRDNPAVFRIIKSMINDGYCSDLLSCNKDNIQDLVSKTTLAFNKKNGYDKKLVENIIYSFAVGCGVISQNDIKRSAQTPIPSKPVEQSSTVPQHFPNSTQQQKNKQFQKQLVKNKKTKWILLIFGIICLIIGPFIIRNCVEENIKAHVENRISELEAYGAQLKVQRSHENKDFQFMGINFHTSKSDLEEIINRDSSFILNGIYENNDNIKGRFTSDKLNIIINSINYRTVVDYVVSVKTIWDNKNVLVDVYFSKDSVVAIKIDDIIDSSYDRMQIDSILSLYSKKYGEPECYSFSPSTRNYIIEREIKKKTVNKEELVKKLIIRYCWSFMNGAIEIKMEGYEGNIIICYASSELYDKYRKYKVMEKQKEIDEKKKEADSIAREKILLEEQKKQEIIRLEQNHKKSINQI